MSYNPDKNRMTLKRKTIEHVFWHSLLNISYIPSPDRQSRAWRATEPAGSWDCRQSLRSGRAPSSRQRPVARKRSDSLVCLQCRWSAHHLGCCRLLATQTDQWALAAEGSWTERLKKQNHGLHFTQKNTQFSLYWESTTHTHTHLLLFWLLPEFSVLCVHQCRAFSQDFCYANSTDLLFNWSRHLLYLWNNYFLQHHTKHSATQTGLLLYASLLVFCTNINDKIH